MDVGILQSRNSISQLSTLLAGPILRRVDSSQVCIWIACSKPVTIRPEVFRTSDFGSFKSTTDRSNRRHIRPIGVGTAESIRLGRTAPYRTCNSISKSGRYKRRVIPRCKAYLSNRRTISVRLRSNLRS